MIKATVNQTDDGDAESTIQIYGNLRDMLGETMILLNSISNAIQNNGYPQAAEIYRETLRKIMMDDSFWHPGKTVISVEIDPKRKLETEGQA